MSGEPHLRRILKIYAAYYNDVRTHLSLDKDAPKRFDSIVATPIFGGLHHHLGRAAERSSGRRLSIAKKLNEARLIDRYSTGTNSTRRSCPL
jgi:hypothetical protein